MLLKTAFWSLFLLSAGSTTTVDLCELPATGKGVSVVTTSVLKATTTSKFHVRNIATPVPTTLVPTTQALIRRALVKAQPLADPSDYKGNQERFIETVFLKGEGVESEGIYITPSDNQKANWKIPLTIDDKTVETPIGATAQWFPFGKEPQVWRMVGMTGCTGVIIVGNTGFWVAHWWEGTEGVNGASSFYYKSATVYKERPDPDFKKIAVDIINQATPEDQVANRDTWESLEDLKGAKFGDPFSRANGGGNIYIITKAKGISPNGTPQTKQMYESKIKLLRLALEKGVKSPNTMEVHTYLGNPAYWAEGAKPEPSIRDRYNGVTTIQYTPWDSTDAKNKRVARARVWSELDTTPVIDRKWTPITGKQARRDGALLSKL